MTHRQCHINDTHSVISITMSHQWHTHTVSHQWHTQCHINNSVTPMTHNVTSTIHAASYLWPSITLTQQQMTMRWQLDTMELITNFCTLSFAYKSHCTIWKEMMLESWMVVPSSSLHPVSPHLPDAPGAVPQEVVPVLPPPLSPHVHHTGHQVVHGHLEHCGWSHAVWQWHVLQSPWKP